MSISDDFFMSCSINTIREDFSERDKLVLTLIAPHFASAIRNAFAHERLSSALDATNCGIVALNSQNKCIYISKYARQLLEKYFVGEKLDADFLPEKLISRLKQLETEDKNKNYSLPPAPLKICGLSGDLMIRIVCNAATGEKNLLLEEKRNLTPEMLAGFNLTRREKEVLFWIAQGKTDDVIKSLLGISLRTVHKHVENIYIKLGVETRVAAMLKTLDVL